MVGPNQRPAVHYYYCSNDDSVAVLTWLRYGWIPSDADVSDDIRSKYRWVAGLSITHMEILHGAYRSVQSTRLFLGSVSIVQRFDSLKVR